MIGDDIGWNGNYTYPNVTFFTGGDADLTELRFTWDSNYVYFLLTFDNITDVGWINAAGWLSDSIQAETTAVAICIDTDRVSSSGFDIVDTQSDGLGSVRAKVRLNSTDYWEYMIEICLGDVVLWYYDGLFINEAYRNFPIAANNATYETVEFAVPIDATGDAGLPNPEGQSWMLSVFIGLQDYEHFREVTANEGKRNPDDQNYYDAAIIPEFPLTFGFALIAIVVMAASFKLRKKLRP